MPGNDDVEVQRLQVLQRLGPLVDVAVAHEGRSAEQHVAGEDQLVLREVDDRVSARVGAADEHDPDLPAAAEERHLVVHRHVGRQRVDLVEVRGVGGEHVAVGLQPLALLVVLGRLDLLGEPLQRRRVAGEPTLVGRLLVRAGRHLHPRVLVADDRDVGELLVAVGMVPVVVGVDQRRHRLVGDRRNRGDQVAGLGRRHVRVHENHVLVVDDHQGVAVEHLRRGLRQPDAVADLHEAVGVRRRRPLLRLERTRREHGGRGERRANRQSKSMSHRSSLLRSADYRRRLP